MFAVRVITEDSELVHYETHESESAAWESFDAHESTATNGFSVQLIDVESDYILASEFVQGRAE